ncbi:MAG: glutamate--tRNA ligase [Brachymonas sp.]|nr:glutamate--tRNA ligase [Brachymonas sp.]
MRTRIAPSPTGFLHLGTARTALYCWAFAQHHKALGADAQFILRIEDTDEARSTQEAVDQIIEAMNWLEMKYDEGPFYQMQRMDRYREVIAQMLKAGTAYYCYTQPDELDAMRLAQKERGEKPRYDGRWRPEAGKVLPQPPAGIKPVVRFKSPQGGDVVWEDMVKGQISISNDELDDLIIARPVSEEAAGKGETVGTPTYNFCVVVDDWDMRISHVIRGDDHVNNTPRQINILKALGAPLPVYGHVPMILGPDGEKLSKRHGAVSVTEYRDKGYLVEGMINYLARLGWSHGDDELFSREQLAQWFDGKHLTTSPARWDAAKLNWVNQHYMKHADNERLAQLVTEQLAKRSITPDGRLNAICGLFKDRCETTQVLADWAAAFYAMPERSKEDYAQHVTEAVKPVIQNLVAKLKNCDWNKAAITAAIKATLAETGLKMPQLAMPVRVLLMGTAQTPSLDAVLELCGQKLSLERLTQID